MNKEQEKYLLSMDKLVNRFVLHLSMMKTWDCNPPTDDLNEEWVRLSNKIFDNWKDVDKL